MFWRKPALKFTPARVLSCRTCYLKCYPSIVYCCIPIRFSSDLFAPYFEYLVYLLSTAASSVPEAQVTDSSRHVQEAAVDPSKLLTYQVTVSKDVILRVYKKTESKR